MPVRSAHFPARPLPRRGGPSRGRWPLARPRGTGELASARVQRLAATARLASAPVRPMAAWRRCTARASTNNLNAKGWPPMATPLALALSDDRWGRSGPYRSRLGQLTPGNVLDATSLCSDLALGLIRPVEKRTSAAARLSEPVLASSFVCLGLYGSSGFSEEQPDLCDALRRHHGRLDQSRVRGMI